MGQHTNKTEPNEGENSNPAKIKTHFTQPPYETLENQQAPAKIFMLWDGCDSHPLFQRLKCWISQAWQTARDEFENRTLPPVCTSHLCF